MKSQSTVLIAALALVACGDRSTNDHRGYTKAPLEHPSVLIRSEDPGQVAQYGHPNRVTAEEIELAPQVAAVPAKSLANVALPAGVTQAMVAEGEKLFTTSVCMACHGPTAGGGPMAPALNDAEWLNVDGGYEAITKVIMAGVPTPKQFPVMMPPKGGGQFTDEQVKQLAAYVYAVSRPAGGAAAH